MKIKIVNPTKAIITQHTEDEIKSLRKQCNYTNSSVAFQIKNHYKKHWLKDKDYKTWQLQLDELQVDLHKCLLEETSEGLLIKPGFIPYIENLDVETENELKYPDLKPFPWKSEFTYKPYGYQLDAIANFFKLPYKHGSIDLPTGAGKSLVLLMTCRTAGLPTVIITPSKSIFHELLDTFQHHLGKDLVGGYGDGKKDIKKKITVAIGKSLTLLKPGTPDYDFFKNKQMMLTDESHLFASAQLEEVCHGVLKNVPYRFFVSATQIRNDGTQKMLNAIIGVNVLSMSIKEAIEEGYLCPLQYTIMRTFSTSTKKINDPVKNKREHFLYNGNIAKMVAKISNAMAESKNESTLILVEELKQIKMLKDLIKVPFVYIHSGSKKDAAMFGLEKVDLREQLEKFNSGEVKVLIGTKSISTGTNIYPTHNSINWVGGTSEIVTKQGIMGRSTRLLEKSRYASAHSPKPFARIIDFKVENNKDLERHLTQRIKWYEESGGEIKII